MVWGYAREFLDTNPIAVASVAVNMLTLQVAYWVLLTQLRFGKLLKQLLAGLLAGSCAWFLAFLLPSFVWTLLLQATALYNVATQAKRLFWGGRNGLEENLKAA